jgi:hypothetical protein
LGFQIFNATNDTITIKGMTTKEFLEKEAPNTKCTREMGEYEAPLSNRKIREVLYVTFPFLFGASFLEPSSRAMSSERCVEAQLLSWKA